MGKKENIDRPVIKTVYDPCPVGYHVPNRNAFTSFSKATDDAGKTGLEYFNSPEEILSDGPNYKYYNFYSSWEDPKTVYTLPALGYREIGNLKNVTLKAYAWTASIKGDGKHDAARLYVALDEKQVHPLSEWYTQFGFAIFPAMEGEEVTATH